MKTFDEWINNYESYKMRLGYDDMKNAWNAGFAYANQPDENNTWYEFNKLLGLTDFTPESLLEKVKGIVADRDSLKTNVDYLESQLLGFQLEHSEMINKEICISKKTFDDLWSKYNQLNIDNGLLKLANEDYKKHTASADTYIADVETKYFKFRDEAYQYAKETVDLKKQIDSLNQRVIDVSETWKRCTGYEYPASAEANISLLKKQIAQLKASQGKNDVWELQAEIKTLKLNRVDDKATIKRLDQYIYDLKEANVLQQTQDQDHITKLENGLAKWQEAYKEECDTSEYWMNKADHYEETLKWFANLKHDTLILDINNRAKKALQCSHWCALIKDNP